MTHCEDGIISSIMEFSFVLEGSRKAVKLLLGHLEGFWTLF
jgi:hypothetical protein